MHDTEVEFGRRYRDDITGFEGVATGIHFYMTGCTRVSLESVVDKKQPGKLDEIQVFDSVRLIDTETNKKMDQPKSAVPPRTVRTTGGPRGSILPR